MTIQWPNWTPEEWDEALRGVKKFNPNHVPAGSPQGGQFAPKEGVSAVARGIGIESTPDLFTSGSRRVTAFDKKSIRQVLPKLLREKNEVGLLVGEDGTVLAGCTSDDPWSVSLNALVGKWQAVEFVHNHPGGAGLSDADVGAALMLRFPAMTAVMKTPMGTLGTHTLQVDWDRNPDAAASKLREVFQNHAMYQMIAASGPERILEFLKREKWPVPDLSFLGTGKRYRAAVFHYGSIAWLSRAVSIKDAGEYVRVTYHEDPLPTRAPSKRIRKSDMVMVPPNLVIDERTWQMPEEPS